MKKVRAVFMNNLCIVAKNEETYFIKRLSDEATQEIIFFNPWSRQTLPEASAYLIRTSGIYGDDQDLEILETISEKKCFNSLRTLKMFRDKVTQFQFFAQLGIPCIPWCDLRIQLPQVDPNQSYLVKPVRGQGGWGIQILEGHSVEGWMQEQRLKNDLSYVLQPFLQNRNEYRYFFIGDKTITLKRLPQKNVMANFTQGGEAELSSLSVEVETMLKKLIKASGAYYGAIDLFVQGPEVHILELNVVPGIEQLEKVSGENIAKIILGNLVG